MLYLTGNSFFLLSTFHEENEKGHHIKSVENGRH